MTTISSPTARPRSPAAAQARTSSHASGAPSDPCLGASLRALRADLTTPTGRSRGLADATSPALALIVRTRRRYPGSGPPSIDGTRGLASRSGRTYTEPYGSVCASPRPIVRGALGSHPTGDPRAPRARRRIHQRPGRRLRDDPHGPEKARADPRGGGAGDDREGGSGADLPPGPARAGARDGLDHPA